MQRWANKKQFSRRLAGATLTLLSLTTSAAQEIAPLPLVKSETLLRTTASWDGVAYESYPGGTPELTVLKITIPANTTLPWHTHPMPNAGYILSGAITVESKETKEKKLLTEGQVLPEMVEATHRGMTGDMPAVLIVFYAGSKGMPVSQPEKVGK